MNRKVIYTCIVGNYDPIRQPLVVDDSFDYICFTDNCESDKVGVWEIRPIPETKETDKTRMSRYVKIRPHKALEEYDYSLYIDANIQIATAGFYEFVNKRIDEGHLICQVPHLKSNCIYEEIRKAYFAGKVNLTDAKAQYQHLKDNGFPSLYGLYENNIILRKHNDNNIKQISEDWWTEYCSFSNRDQFCLMYVYWRNNIMASYLFDEKHNTRNIDCINYIYHDNNKKLENTVALLNKNNQIRRVGRFFHTVIKKYFIRKYLSE